MNLKTLIKSSVFAPIVLFITSALVFVIYALTSRGDVTSGVLLLCGFMTLITGILLLSAVERPPYPAKITEKLTVSSIVETASLLSELGITSDAVYQYASGTVLKINPISAEPIPQNLPANIHFISTSTWSGMVSSPSCTTLLEKLRMEDKLQVPTDNLKALETCISEVFVDMTGFACKASTKITEQSTVIVLEDFALAAECKKIHAVSKKCCTMAGCPVCSLAASIIAEGMRMETICSSVSLEKKQLTIVITHNGIKSQ